MEVDDLGARADGDGVAHRRLHRGRHFRVLPDDEGQLFFHGGEALERELDVVAAGREREEARRAGAVGHADDGESRLGAGDGDGDAGKGRLGLIEREGLDRGFVHLGEGGNGEKQGEKPPSHLSSLPGRSAAVITLRGA